MNTDKLPQKHKSKDVLVLEEAIATTKTSIQKIEVALRPFEQFLRSAIEDLLVQERELTVLYKAQKKAKKEKRLAQKRRGKNYVAPVVVKTNLKKVEEQKVHQKEKKRLYKEAMLYVHPDKFSMQESQQEIATEITQKLINIYKTGTLEELQAYHAHIFSGSTSIEIQDTLKVKTVVDKTIYLKKELEKYQNQLDILLGKYTYKVLTTYENPKVFADELKEYYRDRIFKLKKRTRTK